MVTDYSPSVDQLEASNKTLSSMIVLTCVFSSSTYEKYIYTKRTQGMYFPKANTYQSMIEWLVWYNFTREWQKRRQNKR